MRSFTFSISVVSLLTIASAIPVAAVANEDKFGPPTTVVQPTPALLATCADPRPEPPREPTVRISATEAIRGEGGGMIAGVNGCPAWVYVEAMDEIERALEEECGVGNSYVSHIYCITLQDGGYHVMAEADCLS